MNFIAIDFETANYNANSACSIGLVRYENGLEVDNFYSLIRPPTDFFVPQFIGIHGITFAKVSDSPNFSEVWQNGILPFLQDSRYDDNAPFVAHNAGFDMNVLCACLEYYQLELPKKKSICTVQLTKKAWKHLPKHNLPYLAAHNNIVYDAHNALSDARTCAQLLLMVATERNISSLTVLLKDVKVFAKPLQSKK